MTKVLIHIPIFIWVQSGKFHILGQMSSYCGTSMLKEHWENIGVSSKQSEYSSMEQSHFINEPDTNNFKYCILLSSPRHQFLWDLLMLLLYINAHTVYDYNANNNINIKMLYKKQDVQEISWETRLIAYR